MIVHIVFYTLEYIILPTNLTFYRQRIQKYLQNTDPLFNKASSRNYSKDKDLFKLLV